MNRHHPYGGAGSYDGGRRGGHGGFDRYSRFPERGRGRGGRGRGGFSNHGYGSGPGYDEGPDTYNQWNDGPQGSQNSFYGQNESYGGYHDNEPSSYDDKSFGNHEDKGFQRGRGRGRGRGNFIPRNEREEQIQNSIIEERINRERPCRTLFIRNIKYETDSQFMRNKFEQFGEIKTFFDLIANRGMIFVTFYDLRAAERARERLQGTEISGRPIDVHFSLPRPDELEGKDLRDLNYGTALATFTNSASGHPIDESEIRRIFSHYGDIKVIRPGENYHDQRFVEFFDSRSCTDAYDNLHQQAFQDGFLTLDIVSDIPDVPLPPGAPPRFEDVGLRPSYDYGADRGRRGGGRGMRGRGGPPGREDWGGRDDFGRDKDSERPGPRDDFGGGGRGRNFRGRGGRGGFNDRPPPFDDRRDFTRAPPPLNNNYGPPPSMPSGPPPSFNGPPSSPPSQQPPGDDRLEQAKKVQQLLAALKQPSAGAASLPSGPTPPVMGAPPPSFWPPSQGMPPGPPPMYGTGPPSMPGMPPSVAPYGMPPPGSATSQSPPLAAGQLPPNIMALLQQASQNPAAGSMPPSLSGSSALYGMPGPPSSATGNSDYQTLMSYLGKQ